MTQVASGRPDCPVSVRDIAEQQRLSPKYLEQILRPLKAAGLIRAVRGKQGGYVLTRPPERITLKQVYESLEGSVAPVECVDCPESCSMHDVCPTRDTWLEIKESIAGVLERTTIWDLLERKKLKAISPQPM